MNKRAMKMTIDSMPRRCKPLFLFLFLLLAPAAQAGESLPGCLALAATDPDQAQAAASAWLRRQPQSPDAMQCRATALFNVGDFVAAAVQFSRLARATTPEKAAAVFYDKAAWAYMRAQQNAAAEQELINAIEHDPGNRQYRQDHAVALMNKERYWDAVKELDYVLQHTPRAAEALALRADCWLRLGQGSRARHDAKLALELQPQQELAQAIINKLAAASDAAEDTP